MSELAELFARDPLKLTKEDRRVIIEAQRASRASFMAGNLKAGAPAKAAKEPKVKGEKLSLDLGMLDL